MGGVIGEINGGSTRKYVIIWWLGVRDQWGFHGTNQLGIRRRKSMREFAELIREGGKEIKNFKFKEFRDIKVGGSCAVYSRPMGRPFTGDVRGKYTDRHGRYG